MLNVLRIQFDIYPQGSARIKEAPALQYTPIHLNSVAYRIKAHLRNVVWYRCTYNDF